jgi:hypothetical protein
MAAGKKGTAEHGTRSMYTKGCRCQECRAAAARASRERREKQKAITEANPELVPHGTYNGYVNWKCRCELCTTANREYQRTRPHKLNRWDRYSKAKAARERKEKREGKQG